MIKCIKNFLKKSIKEILQEEDIKDEISFDIIKNLSFQKISSEEENLKIFSIAASYTTEDDKYRALVTKVIRAHSRDETEGYFLRILKNPPSDSGIHKLVNEKMNSLIICCSEISNNTIEDM